VNLPGVFPTVVRDEASTAFFDAAARGELLLQRCGECGQVLAPEGRTCSRCGGVQLTPHAATGAGRLVSGVVVHQAPVPLLAGAVPYLSGIVELDEGPWLVVRLVDTEPDQLRAGLAVRACFVPPRAEGDEPAETLVAFRPDEALP
jgi:uncharacterized OB-fold protein